MTLSLDPAIAKGENNAVPGKDTLKDSQSRL